MTGSASLAFIGVHAGSHLRLIILAEFHQRFVFVFLAGVGDPCRGVHPSEKWESSGQWEVLAFFRKSMLRQRIDMDTIKCFVAFWHAVMLL